MTNNERNNFYETKFADEFKSARKAGFDYYEVSECGEHIHFCDVYNNSTPTGWSWGPNCFQYYIQEA